MHKRMFKSMVGLLVVVCVITVIPTAVFAQAEMTPAKETAGKWLDDNKARINKISDAIWSYAELGWQEFKSADALRAWLKENGFKVEGVEGLPTAIVATYGSGKPVIGFIGEYDCVPSTSQKAGSAKREPLVAIGDMPAPGHGCGHNLYGTMSVSAAIATTQAMKKHGIKGTVRFYGCPAEEILEGKVFMAKAGLFKEADCILSWHSGDITMYTASPCLALTSVKFSWKGVTAHAGTSPEHGRSGLDAAVICEVATNFIREHMVEPDRIQCVLPVGGTQPNVVPDYAQIWYFLRAPDMDEIQKLLDRVTNCAQAAALATDTKMTREIIVNTWTSLPNITLAAIGWDNFQLVGQPKFTDQEIAWAKEMQRNSGLPEKGINMFVIPKERPTQPGAQGRWSTDAGNVSWITPYASYRVVNLVAGTPGHSWQYVSTVGSSIGFKGAFNACKVMAYGALDLLTKPELVTAVRKEFDERKGDVTYYTLYPEMKPSLDYYKDEMATWKPLLQKYYKSPK